MNDLRKQRIAIDAAGVTACLLLLTAGYFFALAPVFHQKDAATAQHRQLAALRQKSSAAQGTLRQLKTQIDALNRLASHDTLKSAGPARPSARLQEITSLAEARGLTVKGVEPGRAHSDAHFQITPLRLNGTGSFRGCVQFLHDLRHSLEDTVVVDFRLNGAGDGRDSKIDFDLDLCWYTATAASTAQER